MPTTSKEYISVADTAKLIRAALRAEFPGQRFSVRSKSYSGGASITTSWVDGPTDKQVKAVTSLYEGADFDGMIDLKSYHDSILVDEDGNPRVVKFGADFTFTRRSISQPIREATAAEVQDFLTRAGEGELDTEDYRRYYPRISLYRKDYDTGEMGLSIDSNETRPHNTGGQLVEYLAMSREHPRSQEKP